MIFSIFDYSAWHVFSSSGIEGNMESSYFYICCNGNLNELSIFKVMDQGHGEIDMTFFDNLACLGLWDR
jgi:hypothetical protein